MIKQLKPYLILARLHSLSGVWLLLIPAMWSLALNYDGQVSFLKLLFYYLIFIIGAIFMRAFGCVINDMADVKFDAQVVRTASRPLASKQISKKQALWLLVFLAVIPLSLLYFFNPFAQLVALLALFFVVLYPFSKRFFDAPQFILGLTFNWGIILADALLNASISNITWILYIIAIIWTLAYDSVYAYQDYFDDKRIGIKSLAVLIGKKPTNTIIVFYLIMLVLFLWLAKLIYLSYWFYVAITLSFLVIIYKAKVLNYFKPKECFIFFKQNVAFGLLVWLLLLLGRIV